MKARQEHRLLLPFHSQAKGPTKYVPQRKARGPDNTSSYPACGDSVDMSATSRCVLLAGAPDTEDLSWNESGLLGDFDIHFARILKGQPKARECPTQASSSLTPSATTSKWRSVEQSGGHGLFEGRPDNDVPQTQFLSFDGSGPEKAREHLDFLEHSIAVFDDFASSQILQQDAAGGDGTDLDTTIDFTTSFATTSAMDSSFNTTEGSHSPAKGINNVLDSGLNGAISNLKQIPAADYISRILPQTMTVNLMVGVVTVSPARTVRLRKSNAEMDIIELIIGDDSRAGFAISFWLAPMESQNKPADDLRETLRSLRAGDIVLLQNVALSCFRNCVYGQSLSKRFARNSTLITLMEEAQFQHYLLVFMRSCSGSKIGHTTSWELKGRRLRSQTVTNRGEETSTHCRQTRRIERSENEVSIECE